MKSKDGNLNVEVAMNVDNETTHVEMAPLQGDDVASTHIHSFVVSKRSVFASRSSH